jgi:hypothetical protein
MFILKLFNVYVLPLQLVFVLGFALVGFATESKNAEA